MSAPARLLAKSSASPEEPRAAETLQGHTMLVVAAAEELLEARARAALAAAGLPSEWESRLERVVRLAAFVHDLGKCSSQFQATVRHSKARQLVRHEALTLWLCWPGRPLASWLRDAVETEADYVLALLAAAGHHRKFFAGAVAPDEAGADRALTLYSSHADFGALLRAGARVLGLQDPPALEDVVIRATRTESPRRVIERWAEELEDAGTQDDGERRLLAVAKAVVLDADVAGSALPRAGAPARGWIREQLAVRADRTRLLEIAERRLRGHEPREFQRSVAAARAPVTLVTAGCGSGKTIAAYLWAAERHAGRQLWITYPTTGTTTEGFRDYVHGADVVGRLEHGRAAVDIEMLGLDDGEGQRDLDRLDALRAWGAEVVTCTVDTVLGLVQNQRKGLYAFAGLADAAVVFDEIHAYDDALFGALMRFLEGLPGLPALLMTASLPEPRLRALHALCLRVHGRELACISGPVELEALPRYRRLPPDDVDPWQLVHSALERGEKVLWVSNTVQRALDLAAIAGPQRALVYHSRFRYCDRVERHAAVIDAFGREGPALALTTQVAEMSLDLSADLLISDLAPVPALIQRLGRLNRRSTPELPRDPMPFLVLPFDGLPYAASQLDDATRWLNCLPHAAISQSDLVAAWTQDDVGDPRRIASEWLDGFFRTEIAALRESTPGITVVREADASDLRSGRVRAEEVALPMGPPRDARAWREWRRVGCYPIAPDSALDYDQQRGAAWRRS